MRPLLLALLLSSTAFAQGGPPPPADPDILTCVLYDAQPVLVGGMAALQAAVAYPEDARAEGIEGRVVLQFMVDPNGTIVGPTVLHSPDPRLSTAALEALRRMTFTPGSQRGRPVAVRFAVPVTFRLSD